MIGDRMETADVYAVALNVLSASAEAPSREDAMLDAHRLVQGFDEAALRRIAVCIAVEVGWSQFASTVARGLPGRTTTPVLVETTWRPAMRQWVDRLRLEVAWQAPVRSEETSS